MAKTIVICADGSNNTSSGNVSNVFRLVRLLAIDEPKRQVIVYDQGIGTLPRGLREARALAGAPGATGLVVLPGPLWLPWPASSVSRGLGLTLGVGLRRNVRQLYVKLSELYEDGDRVVLFGFSRGAFTVRALAGLIYRCGLAQPTAGTAGRLFADAWSHYKPMQFDRELMNAWRCRHNQRSCYIDFLGAWDTVKSYGGLRPVLLPHLRHNPIVRTVRHAVALDEKRGWYNVTTWGRLDNDRSHAMTRLPPDAIAAIENQDIDEVWFRGSHSDIGGGDDEEATARIARQWMLGQACRADIGLVINAAGYGELATPLSRERPTIHGSLTRRWQLVDRIPRLDIDNSGVWPTRVWAKERHAFRRPATLLRNGAFAVHSSAHYLDHLTGS